MTFSSHFGVKNSSRERDWEPGRWNEEIALGWLYTQDWKMKMTCELLGRRRCVQISSTWRLNNRVRGAFAVLMLRGSGVCCLSLESKNKNSMGFLLLCRTCKTLTPMKLMNRVVLSRASRGDNQKLGHTVGHIHPHTCQESSRPKNIISTELLYWDQTSRDLSDCSFHQHMASWYLSFHYQYERFYFFS